MTRWPSLCAICPQVIQDYFGDGPAWGMELHYFVEQGPLGTAGGVKAAEEFIGDEDFLVFSGDCVCDFDLRECCARHKARKAAVTLLLHRERDPLEYGLVQLSQDNRVERFLEKPGWGEVFTNLVNTGIYFLSPAVLKQIPADTAYDFSRELFPKLLEEGTPLYGDTPYGYWRDMGDTGAYLQAAADALDGKVKLDLLLPQLRAGVWCASPLPESCAVVPPCWIAERVTIGESCLIGPRHRAGTGHFFGVPGRWPSALCCWGAPWAPVPPSTAPSSARTAAWAADALWPRAAYWGLKRCWRTTSCSGRRCASGPEFR